MLVHIIRYAVHTQEEPTTAVTEGKDRNAYDTQEGIPRLYNILDLPLGGPANDANCWESGVAAERAHILEGLRMMSCRVRRGGRGGGG